MKKNMIKEKSFKFSLQIIKLYKKLTQQREYIISKQLLRSWTSIGANIEEALAWQSRKDFLSKISISSKEARETRYRLQLLQESEITDIKYTQYIEDITEIANILTKIVKTTSQSLKKNAN